MATFTVFDSLAATDLPGIAQADTQLVSDATGVTDATAVYIQTSLFVADATAVLEAVDLVEAWLVFNIFDIAGPSDTATPLVLSYVAASDATAVSDSNPALAIAWAFTVNDLSALTDAPSGVTAGALDVFDLTAITDITSQTVSDPQVTAAEETALGEAATLAVLDPYSFWGTDSTEVTDLLAAQILNFPGAVDSLTIDEYLLVRLVGFTPPTRTFLVLAPRQFQIPALTGGDMPFIRIMQDPLANLDYTLDWSAVLNGDTIQTSLWSAPPGIALGTQSVDPTLTKSTVWLSGGTPLQQYLVSNQITTVTGRIAVQSILAMIQQQ